MAKLNMDWFSVGKMTFEEIRTCLWANKVVRRSEEYELYNIVFKAIANANGGDKNGRALQLHEKEKKKMTKEEMQKEMELLGVKE